MAAIDSPSVFIVMVEFDIHDRDQILDISFGGFLEIVELVFGFRKHGEVMIGSAFQSLLLSAFNISFVFRILIGTTLCRLDIDKLYTSVLCDQFPVDLPLMMGDVDAIVIPLDILNLMPYGVFLCTRNRDEEDGG